MKIALLQINPTVGDLSGNAAQIRAAAEKAAGADIAVTPELALLGYLPRDLLLNRGFLERGEAALQKLAGELAAAPPVLVGIATPRAGEAGRPLHNSAVLLRGGKVLGRFHKTLLPTYDVFDEDRYFEPASGPQVLDLDGRRIGISICEDVWNDRDQWQRRRYHDDPIEQLARERVELIVNLSASPFTAGKQLIRDRMLGGMAKKYRVPIAYVNQVGGNDDLIFDGRSLVFDERGTLLARGRAFESDVVVAHTDRAGTLHEDPRDDEELWQALVLGTRDYARKCGFAKAVLGLSGGIDSALTAAIAADALGAQNVLGVLMPSPFSSEGSVTDALACAKALGVRTHTLPIEQVMAAFEGALAPVFAGAPRDVTEENLQARIRGTLLMAVSNKTGALLLTTGNKSELSVGYCTLYGDMNGGLAVIADVWKTTVYRLARWRNERGRVIPEATLTKAPSAELRPNQTDQDSLPPYDVLDAILERHVEDHESREQIVAAGYDPATVERTLRMVRVAEFKRKQAAPGLKVTDRAFGTGWRMPIARKDG